MLALFGRSLGPTIFALGSAPIRMAFESILRHITSLWSQGGIILRMAQALSDSNGVRILPSFHHFPLVSDGGQGGIVRKAHPSLAAQGRLRRRSFAKLSHRTLFSGSHPTESPIKKARKSGHF